MIEALVFSDTHFGFSPSTITVEKVVSLIEKYKPRRVIFNGDTFELLVTKKI